MKSFEGKAVVVRRRTWFLPLSLIGSFVNFIPVSILSYGWYRPAALYVSLPFIFLYLRNAWPSRKDGTIRAGEEGLSVDGALVLPRAHIATGYALPGPPPAVRIVPKGFRGFPFDVQVASREEARDLIDALGLGVGGSTARFAAIYGGMRGQVWRALGMGVGACVTAILSAVTILSRSPSPFVPLVVAASLLPMLAALIPAIRSQTKIVVGVDGILLSRLGKKDFIPYDDLTSVVAQDSDVILERRGKPALRLGFGIARVLGREGNANKNAFVQRIEDARASHAASVGGAGASLPRVAALVARDGRSASEWLTAIRALAADGSYRDSALLPEQFLRIVEDPGAEASARAGAAVALRPMLDDVGRERLRIAAETCAAPTLKAALEAAAKEQAESEALEEALGAVSGVSAGASVARR